MSDCANQSRRSVLKRFIAATALTPLAIDVRAALAADEPLLREDEPAAQDVQYVEAASRSKAAKPGQTCANCSVFDGATGATQGHCVLFSGKLVKAAGWCAGWTNL